MKIYLKTVCQEIFGAMPNGDYTVPDGCDARTALRSCAAQYAGSDLMRDCIDHVVYMCNGRHIQPDFPLSEGDRLMVLRPAHGG